MKNEDMPQGVRFRPLPKEKLKPAHTAGPWEVDRNGVVVGDHGLVSIAETCLIKVEATGNIRAINEARANGKLIASAPSLLLALEAAEEALKIAAGQLLDFETAEQSEPYCQGAALTAADFARVSINKAKGDK